MFYFSSSSKQLYEYNFGIIYVVKETASFMSKHTSSKILAENKSPKEVILGFLYVNPTEALTQEETLAPILNL